MSEDPQSVQSSHPKIENANAELIKSGASENNDGTPNGKKLHNPTALEVIQNLIDPNEE